MGNAKFEDVSFFCSSEFYNDNNVFVDYRLKHFPDFKVSTMNLLEKHSIDYRPSTQQCVTVALSVKHDRGACRKVRAIRVDTVHTICANTVY